MIPIKIALAVFMLAYLVLSQIDFLLYHISETGIFFLCVILVASPIVALGVKFPRVSKQSQREADQEVLVPNAMGELVSQGRSDLTTYHGQNYQAPTTRTGFSNRGIAAHGYCDTGFGEIEEVTFTETEGNGYTERRTSVKYRK